MSLSPLVSFKSRFVTYLLNFPRTFCLNLYRLSESTSISDAPWIPKEHCLLKSCQASLLCPSGKSNL